MFEHRTNRRVLFAQAGELPARCCWASGSGGGEISGGSPARVDQRVVGQHDRRRDKKRAEMPMDKQLAELAACGWTASSRLPDRQSRSRPQPLNWLDTASKCGRLFRQRHA